MSVETSVEQINKARTSSTLEVYITTLKSDLVVKGISPQTFRVKWCVSTDAYGIYLTLWVDNICLDWESGYVWWPQISVHKQNPKAKDLDNSKQSFRHGTALTQFKNNQFSKISIFLQHVFDPDINSYRSTWRSCSRRIGEQNDLWKCSFHWLSALLFTGCVAYGAGSSQGTQGNFVI